LRDDEVAGRSPQPNYFANRRAEIRGIASLDAFSQSAEKRDIQIGRGTHLMHLEAMRPALCRDRVDYRSASRQCQRK
jgi:hypothetical protein